MSFRVEGLVSIAIPVFNASGSLPLLCSRIIQAFSNEPYQVEIIFVDDACPYRSWDVIQQLSRQYRSLVKGVKLSRNCGQQIAVSVGISYSKGDYVIVMDCDLQNPPEAIPMIIRELELGNDIVYTVSKKRNNKRDQWTSEAFWFVLTQVLNIKIVKNQLMMRGMSGRFANQFRQYQEITRTIAGISLDIGLNHSVIEVSNSRRFSGKSSYNFIRRFNLMLDIILSLTTFPLTLIINGSVLIMVGTLIAACYYLYVLVFYQTPAGFTTLALLILGFGSLTTLILGILGKYLANIYQEVRGRPLFIVDQEININV